MTGSFTSFALLSVQLPLATPVTCTHPTLLSHDHVSLRLPSRRFPYNQRGRRGWCSQKVCFNCLFFSYHLLFICRKKKSKGDQTSKGVNQDEGQSSKASPSGSGRNSPGVAGTSDDKKTAAEKRFQQVQRKRVCYPNCVWSCIVFMCAT